MKNFRLFLLFIFLFGCAQGRLKVDTVPSQVSVKYQDESGQLKSLGLTPIDLKLNDRHFNSGVAKLIFNKEGYKDEIVFLGRPTTQSELEISLTLSEAAKESQDIEKILSSEKLERISSRIAEAQNFTHARNYLRAESILLDLINDFPTVSVPYDLLANIYFLTNKKSKALRFYKKADAISPDNVKRDLLIQKLRNEAKFSEGGQ